MIALKVQVAAVTTSFRYPRVQIGRLPTFDMPPPATIYGHLAGVLGEWFDPRGLEFAYVFEHMGRGIDVETAHPIEKGTGKHAVNLRKRGWDFPVNVECVPNPQRREFLLHPRMTLYLRGPIDQLETFRSAFMSPYYAYILGRTQDLATVVDSRLTELHESSEAFFAHTILPYEWRPWILPGVTVSMPAAIDYARQRAARFERYLQLTSPPIQIYSGSQDALSRTDLPQMFPIDPSDVRVFGSRTLSRGLSFLPVQNR